MPINVKIANPRLWSPDDPFLYTFKVKLTGRHGGGQGWRATPGCARSRVQEVDGKQRIVLNGKPTFLLGTLDQGYWPDGIYTAPTDAALKFDIQKTKDLGFNTIRKHIKVEPARWYYWADKLGHVGVAGHAGPADRPQRLTEHRRQGQLPRRAAADGVPAPK